MSYISHDCNFENINQLIFFFNFLRCCERCMITKNSVVEIQILLVNHESRPVKSNHDLLMVPPEGKMRETPGMVVPYAVALK